MFVGSQPCQVIATLLLTFWDIKLVFSNEVCVETFDLHITCDDMKI